jgi:hypothetical protein
MSASTPPPPSRRESPPRGRARTCTLKGNWHIHIETIAISLFFDSKIYIMPHD